MTDKNEGVSHLDKMGYFGRVDEGFLDNIAKRIMNGADNMLAKSFNSGSAQGRLEVRQATMIIANELKRWMAVNQYKHLNGNMLNDFWRWYGVEFKEGEKLDPRKTPTPTQDPTDAPPEQSGGNDDAGAPEEANPSDTPPVPGVDSIPPANLANPPSPTISSGIRRSLVKFANGSLTSRDIERFSKGLSDYVNDPNTSEQTKRDVIAFLKAVFQKNPTLVTQNDNLKSMIGEGVYVPVDSLSLSEMLTGGHHVTKTDLFCRLDANVSETIAERKIVQEAGEHILSDAEITKNIEAMARRIILAAGDSGKGGGGPNPAASGGSSGGSSGGGDENDTGSAGDKRNGGSNTVSFSRTELLYGLQQCGLSNNDIAEITEFADRTSAMDPRTAALELDKITSLNKERAYALLHVLLVTFRDAI